MAREIMTIEPLDNGYIVTQNGKTHAIGSNSFLKDYLKNQFDKVIDDIGNSKNAISQIIIEVHKNVPKAVG